MLKKFSTQIEKGSFASWGLKSSFSCAFIINNETYLAWSGYDNDSSPLMIYNLSTKNRVHSIILDNSSGNSSRIQVVSTFPKYSNEASSTLKWLYAANCKGTVKFFDISWRSENKFQEVSTFQTDFGCGYCGF